MTGLQLTRPEVCILVDVLSLVLNDPDWQQVATATDQEWADLQHAYAKARGSLQV
jgi:hypothetical protein